MKEVHDLAEAQALALAIVDTLPEPFLVLDEALCLLAGSRCFYEVFKEDPAMAHGRLLFELSDGQWDIPGLRQLLETVIPSIRRSRVSSSSRTLPASASERSSLMPSPFATRAFAVKWCSSQFATLPSGAKSSRRSSGCWSIPRNCSNSRRPFSARCDIVSPTACK